MPRIESIFHESWHLVAGLKPRIRSGVAIVRQTYRGKRWYVVQDQANNTHFRLNRSAYEFIGLMDGRRTVAQCWEICLARLEDDAPSQPEALELLGQLASSNLLESELPPDAASMMRRYRQRRKRELQGNLMNLLFPRIPLFDPDAVLNAVTPVFGWIFSWPGLLLWLALFVAAVYAVLTSGRSLSSAAQSIATVLKPGNWLLLYLAFVIDKTLHESAHALACKKFGWREGRTGEVHIMGLMLLVFTPIPYVDASSAWAFKNRWRRVVVGAAGMWMDFAVAATAAILWTLTSPGSAANILCYDLVLIGSVATVLFNGNPFLRYDGYYICCDLLQIPNLLGRCMQYVSFLFRHYLFRVPRALDPTEAPGQRAWLVAYMVGAVVVRVLVSVGILLFLIRALNQYPAAMLLLMVMAAAGIIAWVVVPLGRCVWYVLTSPELHGRRPRALLWSGGIAAAAIVGLGMIPLPQHCRAEAVVRGEPQRNVYAQADGFLHRFVASGREVTAGRDGTVLVRLTNPDLLTQRAELLAQWDQTRMKRLQAIAHDPAEAQIYARQIRAINDELTDVKRRIADLVVRAPVAGEWVAADLDRRIGAYFHRGDPLGEVVNCNQLLVLAAVSQDQAGRIFQGGSRQAQIRPFGQPGDLISARIVHEYPGGETQLFSAALSYLAGGAIAPAAKTPQAARNPFFVLELQPTSPCLSCLRPGQTVSVRLSLQSAPAAVQVWDMIARMIQ